MRKKFGSPVLFEEMQHLRQFWLWALLLGLAAVFWAGFIVQVILGKPLGNKPVSNVGLVLLVLLVGLGLPLFFRYLRLHVWLLPDRLCLQFRPFHPKPIEIFLREIKETECVTYNPIADYGGWGIRWGRKGKAYNAHGSAGVKLHFYQRRPLLIGSQKPEQLREALENAITALQQH